MTMIIKVTAKLVVVDRLAPVVVLVVMILMKTFSGRVDMILLVFVVNVCILRMRHLQVHLRRQK